MKNISQKFVSLLTILSIVVPVSFIPTTALAVGALPWADGFESGNLPIGWTQADAWSRDNSDPHADVYLAKVVGTGAVGDKILRKDISTAGNESVDLSFWYHYDGLDDGDSVVVQWYDGSSWNTITTFTGVDNDADDMSEWTEFTTTLPSGADDNSAFSLRFFATMNTGNDRFYLDDVSLDGAEIIVEVPVENTAELCTDGDDNDNDNLVDLADPQCAEFRPKLTVTKVVNGGEAVVESFSLEANPGAIALTSGVQKTFTTHGVEYTISENDINGYTGVFSGDCAEDGTITLNANDVKSCTLTNTYTNDEPSSGSIEITKYACPEGTEVVRSQNGVDGTVPETCQPMEGAIFGYVHGDQTDAEAPHPELAEAAAGNTITGTTDENGILTFSDLDTNGRYLIVETDSEGVQLPHDQILGIYCEGDGDESDNNDNQEITFATEGEPARCVAYNEVPDMCPDMEGYQAEVPEGGCVNPEEPNQCVEGEQWADEVISFEQGLRKDGSAVLEARSNPNLALGEAENTGAVGTFVSLGQGGSIVVKFNAYIIDSEGDDISIHETTNGTYPAETALIEVSQDGTTWEEVGTADNTGVDYFDISATGFTWIQYVRITDTSDFSLHTNDADGFDLNAVDATYGVCEEPVPPVCVVVSDITNTVEGGGNAVETFVHNSWTSLDGADWIWSSEFVEEPVTGEVKTFLKSFNLSGTVTDATLEISSDNGYVAYINDVEVAADPLEKNYLSVDTVTDITDNLVTGVNTLKFVITNMPFVDGTPESNPAGLLYKLTIDGGVCGNITPDDDNDNDNDQDNGSIIKIIKKSFGSIGTFFFDVTNNNDEEIEITTPNGEGTPQDYNVEVTPGEYNTAYTITETAQPGWQLTNVECEEDAKQVDVENGVTVLVDPGQTINCTFENTAVAELTIIKHVINDSGETASADDFLIDVTNNDALFDTINGAEGGTVLSLSAGTYSVVEQFNNNYEASYSSDCTGTIALGESKTCTITNDDITSDGDGNSSGSVANSGGSVAGASIDTEGSVLGALTCSFLTYEQLISVKNGIGADPAIITALQEWLNSSQNAGLTVNGIYDEATKFAIMLLQEKYPADTLTPWGLVKATGNIWLTTGKLILRLVCGENVALPPLVPFN